MDDKKSFYHTHDYDDLTPGVKLKLEHLLILIVIMQIYPLFLIRRLRNCRKCGKEVHLPSSLFLKNCSPA